MLGDSAVVAFVATTDVARSRRFYQETLGLRVVEQDSFGCVLDAHGTMLRLTAVAELEPAAHTVLGWRVRDLEATVDDLLRRGVTFTHFYGLGQDERGVWSTPSGEKVAWFTDPDGHTLSLTQFAVTS